MNITGPTNSSQLASNSNDFTIDEVQSEQLKTIPKMDVNMGKFGKNGENLSNAINFDEIQSGYNQTKKTGNSKYLNSALDKNAAKISKAARRVLEVASKKKNLDKRAKQAFNAFLNPNSKNAKAFLSSELAKRVSPIQMALNYRKAGGSNAERDLKNNSKKKQAAVAYDSSIKSNSKDYLNKLKAQLGQFDNLLDEDDGMLAMRNYDPTVSQKAVNQLNDEESRSDKETIHPDAGLSLWKIITNRYNVIKLKKGFN